MLAATIVGSSMAFIDTSVVNVALPAIQADLAAPVRETQWVANAYMLMLGALLLVGGAAGDRFGRRRMFVIGTVVFAAASVACAWAPTAAALIAARAIQGVGGALLVPASLAIISAAFPESERGRAIGTWAGASALTTALGPVIGGWLVDTWSRRIIFLINVPIAVVAIALAMWRMPESREDSRDVSRRLAWRRACCHRARHARVWTDAVVGQRLDSMGLAWNCGRHIELVRVARGSCAQSDDAAGAVPIQNVQRRQHHHAAVVLCIGRRDVLRAVQFDSNSGYSAALAGASFLPFSLDHGRVVAVVRRTDRGATVRARC